MRNLIGMFAMLLLLGAGPALAQEEPVGRFQMATGYGHVYTQEEPAGGATISEHGFFIAPTYGLNRWLSVRGDFGGSYGVPFDTPQFTLKSRTYWYVGGLQFDVIKNRQFNAYMHGLVGGVRMQVGEGPDTISHGVRNIYGAGLDWFQSRKVGVRVFEVSLVRNRLYDVMQTGYKVETGIVFRP